MNPINSVARLMFLSVLVVAVTGCTVSTQMAAANADAQQVPQVQKYASNRSADQTFTAAVKAMTSFGTVLSSDRGSGIVQGQKGNWVLSANVGNAKTGATVEISPRYVPGKKMDFNSKEALLTEYVSKLESALGEKLAPTAP